MDIYIKSILEGTGGNTNSWSWKEEDVVVVEEEMEVGQQEWVSSEQCETLESVVAGVSKVATHRLFKLNNSKGGVEAQTIAARARRRNISEKMRELESLIPSGGVKKSKSKSKKKSKGRVETVKMLEEAIKYVTYLKAQLEVLESHCHCPFTANERERRLGLLLMSPAIQRNLYTEQCCLCIAND